MHTMEQIILALVPLCEGGEKRQRCIASILKFTQSVDEKKNRRNFCALGNLTEVKGHDVLKVVLGDVIYIPLSTGKERHYCCSLCHQAFGAVSKKYDNKKTNDKNTF